MMKSLPVFLSLSALFLFNACAKLNTNALSDLKANVLSEIQSNAFFNPQPVDHGTLQKQIQDNEQKIAALEEQVSRQKQELDYEIKRSEVLEKENAALEEDLTQARNNIRNTFIALTGTFEGRQEELFDCYIGYAPIDRNKTYSSPVKTLLVDFGNPITADNVIICGAELYNKTPMTVQFCLIRPAYANPNALVVEKITPEYEFTTTGKQKVVFPRTQRFSASKDFWLGVYISPSADLPYDDIGTGKVLDFHLTQITPMVTVLQKPTSLPGRDGKAISFRFFGITFMN